MRQLNKTDIYRETLDYIMIAAGMLSYCIGWTIFLLPNKISIGGVAGLASILFWGTGIEIQATYFVLNAVLLTVALRILGWKFCVKTIFGVVMLTTFTSIFRTLFPNPQVISNQPFMTSIIGAVFCGVGQGFGLSHNGSSGGSEVVATIINKYHDISLGRVLLLVDMLIITLSYVVLHSWEQVIYGYVVLIITSFVLDHVVSSGRRSVQFLIISDKYDEICKRITENPPHRGCTIVDAHGYYSNQEMKLLIVVTRLREARLLYHMINDIDERAFVTQTQVMGVFGQGFDKFKVKQKKQQSNRIATDR